MVNDNNTRISITLKKDDVLTLKELAEKKHIKLATFIQIIILDYLSNNK